MLGKLLELIKSNQGVISKEFLCDSLDVSPEMLDGLLASLVRLGRLAEIKEDKPESCPKCEDCAIEQHCDLTKLFHEKRYEVLEPNQQA